MRLLAPLLVASLIGASAIAERPASAQAAKPGSGTFIWRNLAGWEVGVERAKINVCYIISRASGPRIRLGYDPSRAMDLILMHDAWKSLVEGTTYEMVVHLDDRQHPASMRARKIPDGSIALFQTMTDAAAARRFLTDFQRGNRLTVFFQDRQLATYSLQATQAAGEEFLRCQQAQDQANPPVAGTPANDPFGRAPGGPPATSPTGSRLTADQRLAAIRLMANLMTRMPGFRILSEDEVKALDARLAATDAAVVWNAGGALGTLQVFPDRTDADVRASALALVNGADHACDGQYDVSVARDVRAPDVRRVHFTCMIAGSEVLQRYVVMPFGKDGLYVFGTAGTLKDKDVIVRAEELLRNALFEIVKR